MPSAANAKSEKPAPSEAADNSPIRQIMTIIEHKIRNLEKRKGKLTSYRDLQKAGKELNADQKVAVAKYDEVVQTLEFARDMSKQVAGIAISAERDAKKQAKKEAWVRSAAETNKIREVLLVLDCLVQMGNTEARNDFLNGTNGAAKLAEGDLKILDELYPEVTPKHEVNEEGQPGFHNHTIKAAEHLYSIIDGRPKEFLGTTYTHIKEIVTVVHECGYFDRSLEIAIESEESQQVPPEEEELVEPESEPEPELNAGFVPPPATLPVPPAPAVVPAPAYPLRPIPPITLQEVEHAYFAQQYPQQRPIAEVIGSQNFFFLQESEIDSPVGTPAPPQLPAQASPTAAPALPIPTQTFTNQHFVMRGPGPEVPLPQPHFPHPEHAGYAPVQLSQVPHAPHVSHVSPHGPTAHVPVPVPTAAQAPVPMPIPVSAPVTAPEDRPNATPEAERPEDEPKDDVSPERDDTGDRRTQGQGDGQARFRRFGRGRGAPNGHRGRGAYSGRPNDGYRGRNTDYVPRGKDYSNRQYDGYRKERDDSYYGNGDASDSHHENGRERHYDGYRGRGRGAPRGSRPAPRTPRAHHYARKPDRLD